MDQLGYFFLIFACIFLSAFFSGSETALLRLRKEQLEKDIKEAKGPTAFAVRDLVKNTSQLLVTILFGNNVVNILGAASASALAIHFLGEKWGVLISTLAMTVIILIFSEILPKAISARNPIKVSYIVGLPLYIIHKVLKPLHWLFDKLIDPFIQRITQGTEEPVGTIDEILAMAKMAPKKRKAGSPLAIISSTAGAAEMKVKDIMTPRPEIVAFSIKTKAPELLEKLLESRYTRVPIYLGSMDKMVGLVHLKDLIKAVQTNQGDLRKILKPVIKVPESKPILSLLSEMQRSLIQMAIVKDEFGTTQGLVTLEDVLEEIVGEIRDEFDIEELKHLKKVSENCYEAEGMIYVTDFNRDTGWKLPAESGDTLSGVVFDSLGRIPHPKEEVRIDDYVISVQEITGTRINRVQVRLEKKEEPD
jgi:putative hemolysin